MNANSSGSSIVLGQLPLVSSLTAQSAGLGNASNVPSLPPSGTFLNVTPSAVVPTSPTAPQSSSDASVALRRLCLLQNVIISVAGIALGIISVLYGVKSYQASVRANEIASHANELAMRESCRAHPKNEALQSTALCQAMRASYDYDDIVKRSLTYVLQNGNVSPRSYLDLLLTIIHFILIAYILQLSIRMLWRCVLPSKMASYKLYELQRSTSTNVLILDFLYTCTERNNFSRLDVPMGTLLSQMHSKVEQEYYKMCGLRTAFFNLRDYSGYDWETYKQETSYGGLVRDSQCSLATPLTMSNETWLLVRAKEYNHLVANKNRCQNHDFHAVASNRTLQFLGVAKSAAKSACTQFHKIHIPDNQDHVVRVVILHEAIKYHKFCSHFALGALLGVSIWYTNPFSYMKIYAVGLLKALIKIFRRELDLVFLCIYLCTAINCILCHNKPGFQSLRAGGCCQCKGVKPKTTKCAAVKDLCNVRAVQPGRLHSLKNDIFDLETICLQLIATRERTAAKLDAEANASIHQLISRAKQTLLEIQCVLRAVKAISWFSRLLGGLSISSRLDVQPLEKESTRLQHLQDDIKTINYSLKRFLGTSYSHGFTRIRLELQTITTLASDSTQEQTGIHNEFQNSLLTYHDSVTDTMKEILAVVYKQIAIHIPMIEDVFREHDGHRTQRHNQLWPFRRQPLLPYRKR